jgi:hypothetical protein
MVALAYPSAAPKASRALQLTLRDDGSDGIRSDGNPAYVNHADPSGKTPSIYADGNITLDLRGSTRTMYLDFGAPVATYSSAGPLPKVGYYAVLMQSLATSSGGITDLAPGTSGGSSIVFTWTGLGVDGRTHEYTLAYRQRNGSGVWASANLDGTWTVESNGYARVSISSGSGGKTGWWTDLADFAVPFRFDASPL